MFLEQLRAAREASGPNHREVADKLGRSQSFVTKCEQGHNRVDVAHLVKFCRVPGVPLVSGKLQRSD
ncbi:MAG: XRE family transcriptional regulator [Proteobacteria bacterium]|nr:MAG: XRE family transcriptional regulator [Pseudomonadota bacterium]